MTARAILPLAGPHGVFAKGAEIRGVPDEIVDIWVRDGAAERTSPPTPPTTEDGRETATAPAPEKPSRPSRR
jgi:hypothetical protein